VGADVDTKAKASR